MDVPPCPDPATALRVLVTGASTAAGRRLLEQLTGRGAHVLGVDANPGPTPEGPQVLRVPSPDKAGYVDALARLVEEHRIDLLIPTLDAELPLLASAGLPQALVSPLDAINAAGDRWLTLRRLASAGIPAPRAAQGWQVSATVADLIGVPFVVKHRMARNGSGVRVCDRWPTDEPIDRCDIVAEFVPGPEYAVAVHIADEPELDVALADAPDVAALAVAACREIGIVGPAEVGIRRRSSGKPVVLEISARFGARGTLSPQLLDAALARARRAGMAVPA